MKSYMKPEIELVAFASEAVAEGFDDNGQGNVGTYDNDGAL